MHRSAVAGTIQAAVERYRKDVRAARKRPRVIALKESKQMKRFGILGLMIAVLAFASPDASAIPPGGVVRGGIRGAMIGGAIGGSRGARVGRAVGAAAGGVRRANYRAYQSHAYREARARAAFRATAPYRAGVHSNFYVAPPRVIVRPPVVLYP